MLAFVVEPRRGTSSQLTSSRRRRRSRGGSRPEGERPRARLVARRHPAGVHVADARSAYEARTTRASGPAPVHAALLQARQRGLDRRPAPAHLRGRRRRQSTEPVQRPSGDFEQSPPVVAGRRVDRLVVHGGAAGGLGHRSSSPTCTPWSRPAARRTRSRSPAGACSAFPAWSPDGALIAFFTSPAIFDDPRHAQLAVWTREGRERRSCPHRLDRIAPRTRRSDPPLDGDDVVFAVEDAGNNDLYRVAARRLGRANVVTDGGPGGDRIRRGRRSLVYTGSTPTTFSELYLGDEPATQLTAAFTSRRELTEPERFVAVSKDGTEVEAWIMRPAGFEEGGRYPVLLNIHGGPFTQYGNRFFDEFQVLRRRRVTQSSTATRAARRATARRGGARSAARRRRRARAGAASTTTT